MQIFSKNKKKFGSEFTIFRNFFYQEERGTFIGQPLEKAMLSLAQKVGLSNIRSKFIRMSEIPFSAEHKWMAVKAKPSDETSGAKYYVKGAPEVILSRCEHTFKKSNFSSDSKALSDSEKEKLQLEASELASKGLRVLAFASGEKTDRLTFHGFVGFIDPPRPGIKATIASLQRAGIEIKMITGDSRETAEAVAMSLGIADRCISIEGRELDTLSKGDLFRKVAVANVYYRVSPRHKLKIVKLLQEHTNIVCMTGDGVNDAAALKCANIGVAMGLSGTDVSKEASDMILSNDDLGSVVAAVEEGKAIFNNIRNFVCFQLSTSIAALSLITISSFFNLPNPVSKN